jgi:hypothetical protein
VNGFPNLFVDLDLEQAPGFLSDLAAVASRRLATLRERYAILRNSEGSGPSTTGSTPGTSAPAATTPAGST